MNAYLSLIEKGRGGRLFEAGRLLTFSTFRMGAYSRWALIRGWALIRINTVSRVKFLLCFIVLNLERFLLEFHSSATPRNIRRQAFVWK